MRPRLQLRPPPAVARARLASPLGAGASGLRASEFLRRLDRMLDQRPVVQRDSVGHTVWVFGAVGFRANRLLPGVYPVFREEGGRVRVGDCTVELFRPLRTHHFLSFVLRRLGLSCNGPQRELFRSPSRIVAEEAQLVREAWRRLLRDPRFEELRSRRLPAALGLDPVLRAITLAARRSLSSRVACDEYSLVWRHERALRVVARENPGLLPIVVAALQEQRILPHGDAVKELHLFFRYRKLSPATWRWLVRHGCRVLQPAWERSRVGDRTDSAVEFLREIERAGHPAPPPAWAVRAWLVAAAGYGQLDPGWNPVPSAVVASCLGEALRARGTVEESLLGEDLRLVFSWAARSRWRCRGAGRARCGRWWGRSLSLPHNCIAGYAGKCQEGWVLQGVLGMANAPVEKALRAFASDFAESYNEMMAGMPHESEGWSLRLGEELARLEGDGGAGCCGV